MIGGRPLVVAAILVAAGSFSATLASPQPAFRLRVLTFVDHSRRTHFQNGTSSPRVLATFVRVPTRGRSPYPLVVFAHGFALPVQSYSRLLDAWARAGYAVAAPVFPIESPNAPGGAARSDLVNEPADLDFVLGRLLASTSPIHRLVDATHVAFAGHSDGGVAALAAAYDRRYRRRHVQAAIIMSGATFGGFSGPAPGSPPLLAIQGTADPFNSPITTSAYFQLMRRPKFLLWLIGAPHKDPYTTDDRWSGVVNRATIAFLAHVLRGAPLRPLVTVGSEPGVARIVVN